MLNNANTRTGPNPIPISQASSFYIRSWGHSHLPTCQIRMRSPGLSWTPLGNNPVPPPPIASPHVEGECEIYKE